MTTRRWLCAVDGRTVRGDAQWRTHLRAHPDHYPALTYRLDEDGRAVPDEEASP